MAKNNAVISGTIHRIFKNEYDGKNFLNLTVAVQNTARTLEDGSHPQSYVPVGVSGPLADRILEKVKEGLHVTLEGPFEVTQRKDKDPVYRVNAKTLNFQDCGYLNKVIVLGRLTHDPEIRRTADGTTVTTLSIAVDRNYRNKKGEWETITSFIRINVWDKLAEQVQNDGYEKGKLLWVTGMLVSRKYEKDGKTYYPVEITADSIIDAGSGKYFVEDESGQTSGTDKEEPPYGVYDNDFTEVDDEELPFD